MDDLPAVLQATNHVFTKAGLPEMSLDQFRAEFSLPFKKFYDRHTPHVPLEQLEEWFHERFEVVGDSVEELPHARAFLIFCRQRGIRTFLLSTVHQNHFRAQTIKNGFHKFLDRSYVEVWDKKARIHELLEENRLNAKETLFIGDMQHDIETAHHGGIRSCAVLTGFNRLDQLRASNPDLIVEHLGELQEILERHDFELPSGQAGHKSSALAIPVSTVGALIYNAAGKVLMIRTQKWSNLWGIPGGKIKLNETSEDALRREIKEETDLQIEDIEFVMVQDCIQSTEFYRSAHFILLNYKCRCVGEPKVKLNEEAQEFRWVTPAVALSMPLNQPTQKLLLAAEPQLNLKD